MSDFGRAVTAVEMALKALHLDGQITVQMDSETERIVLDDAVSITHVSRSWVTRDVSVKENKIHSEATYSETISLVDAVTEAVVALVARQTRSFLGEIFEAVEDEDGLVD